MSDRLIPCPACGRHVRVRDEVCPFCATSATGFAGSLALPSAAVVVFALAGCAGAAADPPGVDAGPPPIVDAGDAGDAGIDAGSGVAMYGAPGCDVAPSPARGGFDGELAALAAFGLVIARRRRRDQD